MTHQTTGVKVLSRLNVAGPFSLKRAQHGPLVIIGRRASFDDQAARAGYFFSAQTSLSG